MSRAAVEGAPSPEAAAARFREHAESVRRRGLDLSRAPVMRLDELQAGSGRRCLWTYHHLLLDGWSASLVLRDVLQAYEALRRGLPCDAPASPRYREYLAWLDTQDLARGRRYWTEALRDREEASGLSGRSASWADGMDHRTQCFELARGLTGRLRAWGRRHRVTLGSLLHGAWALLLSRHSGRERVLFGSVVSGRASGPPAIDRMVGLFVNTLPCCLRVSPAEPVLAYLRRCQAQLMEMRGHEHTALSQIQKWAGAAAGQPMFDTVLVFDDASVDAAPAPFGAAVSSVSQAEARTGYPLTLEVLPGSELVLRFTAAGRRLGAATVPRLARHLEALLEAVAEERGTLLRDLPMAGEAERHQVVVEWNDTRTEGGLGGVLHRELEAQASHTPDATAVVSEQGSLTYRSLHRRAGRLAARLRSHGVGVESRVGICAERSLETVCGLLAILKAGAAYVPLDPDEPRERLRFMGEDSRPDLVLTQPHLRDLWTSGPSPVLLLDRE